MQDNNEIVTLTPDKKKITKNQADHYFQLHVHCTPCLGLGAFGLTIGLAEYIICIKILP